MNERLEVWLADASLGPEQRVGFLMRTSGRSGEVVRFEYDASWLASRQAFAIDPEIPLTPGAHFAAPGRVLHGVFRDTAPDRWGRVLMERREAALARSEARVPCRLSDWDFLLGVNDASRMGALRFRDAQASRWLDDREPGVPPATRLRELEAIARRIDQPGAEDLPEYETWLRMLVVPGTSLGGARPKASFADEHGELWLAKFPANEDRYDVGAWEFLTHQVAQRAGVDVAEAKLLRFSPAHRTVCVKRFDRVAGSRRLYASAMTLLGRNDGDAGSYLEIAQVLQRQGDPARIDADLRQLYRRIVLSILVGNRDDHFRNHGFLRMAQGWSLSPAFDLNPNPDKREHALAIDDTHAVPEVGVLRKTARFYRLSDAAAVQIETEVRQAVADWKSVAAGLDLPGSEMDVLGRIIDPTR